jgi:hypothetical protein
MPRTTKKAGDPGFEGAQVGVDARPLESQEEQDTRRRREIQEDGDRIVAQHRALDDRQRRAAAARPRVEALRSLVRAAFRRGHVDLHARARALHQHPVYASLPATRQAEWDAFLSAANEAERDGNFGPLWRSLEQTAQVQADALVTWTPPEEAVPTPDELAAQVPR